MSEPVSGNPALLPLSSVNPGDEGHVAGRVLAIEFEGPTSARTPVVLLMQDTEGVVFEAWLGNSNAAMTSANGLSVADSVKVYGKRCPPIRSHRDYDGLRVSYDRIDFLSVIREVRKDSA
jgi:hypothetical protein